jgi:segregation and condensation protein A
LQSLEAHQENVFYRDGEGVQVGPDAEVALRDVSIFDLITAFSDALKRVKQEELTEIFAERFTVAEKIDVIVRTLGETGKVSLVELFAGMSSRHEIVCTFLAVLELMRLKQIQARQDTAFGDILIVQAAT